jgi:hypothetical protein
MASSRMMEVPMPTRAEQLARVAQLEREATRLSVFVEPERPLRKANPLIKPVEEPPPHPWWKRLTRRARI